MVEHFSFEEIDLQGVYLIKPFLATDNRGSFIKDYSKKVFLNNEIDHDLKEIFYTKSKKGVIRAVHFQEVKQQAKLVRCISGEIYDVVVDLRKDSNTFGQWRAFYLNDTNNHALLIPEGFGHGYLVMEDSIVSYKCAEDFYGEYDSGIKWNDPDLNINWPIVSVNSTVIVSDKDQNLQSFREYKKR